MTNNGNDVVNANTSVDISTDKDDTDNANTSVDDSKDKVDTDKAITSDAKSNNSNDVDTNGFFIDNCLLNYIDDAKKRDFIAENTEFFHGHGIFKNAICDISQSFEISWDKFKYVSELHLQKELSQCVNERKKRKLYYILKKNSTLNAKKEKKESMDNLKKYYKYLNDYEGLTMCGNESIFCSVIKHKHLMLNDRTSGSSGSLDPPVLGSHVPPEGYLQFQEGTFEYSL